MCRFRRAVMPSSVIGRKQIRARVRVRVCALARLRHVKEKDGRDREGGRERDYLGVGGKRRSRQTSISARRTVPAPS